MVRRHARFPDGEANAGSIRYSDGARPLNLGASPLRLEREVDFDEVRIYGRALGKAELRYLGRSYHPRRPTCRSRPAIPAISGSSRSTT